MRLVKAYVSAFGRSYTFDPRKNPYLWFGFFWGLPVPVFSLLFDLALGPAGRGLAEVVTGHPLQIFFLAHPPLFAAGFGAMGTLRHDLELENVRLIEELRGLATTDPLTGIPNRRRAIEELEASLSRSERTREPFTVVMIDLDGFKRVNDELGHPAGDVILRKTAAALREVTRQGDVLGRYGGDEFLLIAHGALDDGFLDRALEAVLGRTGLRFGAGVARFPEDGSTASALVAKADARLYHAKRETRSRRRESV